MSLTLDGFYESAKSLAALNGLDEDTALELMSLIGDALCLDEDGLILVTTEDGTKYHLRYPTDEEGDVADDEG